MSLGKESKELTARCETVPRCDRPDLKVIKFKIFITFKDRYSREFRESVSRSKIIT